MIDSEIRKLRQQFEQGETSCEAIVTDCLQKLQNDPHNATNTVLTESALEKAKMVDERMGQGKKPLPLEGIPFGVKDVYLIQGQPASASSSFLKSYIAPYTATAIQKLIDAGAIPIAKENCDSFGHGSTNENSAFGAVKNALDKTRVSGGSSGGGAVNVALGHTVFSIGGDTGGSIRQPAGYNKIYGLKPTYGRVSRFGLMAYASSTDCVGHLARGIEDIRMLTNLMSGKDALDQTSIESIPIPCLAKQRAKKLRVGFYKQFLETKNIDVEIKNAFWQLVQTVKEQGIEIQEIEMDKDAAHVATYYVLAMAETASNLARLDGSHYGERIKADTSREGALLARSTHLTTETQRRIIGGNQVIAHGHAEGIYLKARTLRSVLAQKINKEFEKIDILLSPVSPTPPPLLGKSLDDPLSMYLSDMYTVCFSLAGIPTLTAPLKNSTGVQISSGKMNEGLILEFAAYLQNTYEG